MHRICTAAVLWATKFLMSGKEPAALAPPTIDPVQCGSSLAHSAMSRRKARGLDVNRCISRRRKTVVGKEAYSLSRRRPIVFDCICNFRCWCDARWPRPSVHAGRRPKTTRACPARSRLTPTPSRPPARIMALIVPLWVQPPSSAAMPEGRRRRGRSGTRAR